MKPMHESSTVVITTTQQRQLIEQLMKKHLEVSGSMLAQVFPDGLKLRVLTPTQTKELYPAIAKALGTSVSTGLHYSAFQKPEKGGAA